MSSENASHKALNGAVSGNAGRNVWFLCPFFFMSLKNVSHQVLNDPESGNKWRTDFCVISSFTRNWGKTSNEFLNGTSTAFNYRKVTEPQSLQNFICRKCVCVARAVHALAALTCSSTVCPITALQFPCCFSVANILCNSLSCQNISFLWLLLSLKWNVIILLSSEIRTWLQTDLCPSPNARGKTMYEKSLEVYLQIRRGYVIEVFGISYSEKTHETYLVAIS
jgi:hypothetical protein